MAAPFFQCGASLRRKNGAAIPLEKSLARVRVDADHQHVTLAAGAFKVTDVADVQQVKATIGKNNSLAAPPVLGNPLDHRVSGKNLRAGVHWLVFSESAAAGAAGPLVASLWMAGINFSRVRVSVTRLITPMPPA